MDAGQTAYTHEVARVSELIARAVTAIKRNASGRPYIGGGAWLRARGLAGRSALEAGDCNGGYFKYPSAPCPPVQ